MKLFIIRWGVDDNCSCCEHRHKCVNELWGPREKEDHFTSMWGRSSAFMMVTFHSHWGAKSLHIANRSIFTERGEEDRVWCSWEWPGMWNRMNDKVTTLGDVKKQVTLEALHALLPSSGSHLDYLLIFLSLSVSAFRMKEFQFFPGLWDWIKSVLCWNWGWS
jgi:hypothetical protein